jgi:hypothetical protein
VYADLDAVSPDFVVVGDARGADMIVRVWCKERGVDFKEYKAHWNVHLTAAGTIRNQQMLDEHRDADYVLAWPDPNSRGTYDMLRRCFIAGIPKYKGG